MCPSVRRLNCEYPKYLFYQPASLRHKAALKERNGCGLSSSIIRIFQHYNGQMRLTQLNRTGLLEYSNAAEVHFEISIS